MLGFLKLGSLMSESLLSSCSSPQTHHLEGVGGSRTHRRVLDPVHEADRVNPCKSPCRLAPVLCRPFQGLVEGSRTQKVSPQPPKIFLKSKNLPSQTIERSQLAGRVRKMSLRNEPLPCTVIAFHVCYCIGRYQTAILNCLLHSPSRLPESHVFLL